jgi:predicted enzyme involved in methoxymalonyl-ACP biosynthesis
LSSAGLLRKTQLHNAFFLQVAYKDKYGPLGKIAVMLGSLDGRQLKVDTWVMSCRAFSRRIEHQCLEYLFDKLSAATITFEFQRTDRNGPLQEFLAEILGHAPQSPCVLDRATFNSHKPALHHTVKELDYA